MESGESGDDWNREVLSIGKLGAGLGFATIMGIATFYIFGDRSSESVDLVPDDPLVVERGAKVYAEHCASCHGNDLQGQPNWRARDKDGYLPAPPHDESGHTWHHSDALLFKLTKYGLSDTAGVDYKTRMPAYDGVLSDSDIVAVLSYIKSQWPTRIRERHDRMNENAKRNANSR